MMGYGFDGGMRWYGLGMIIPTLLIIALVYFLVKYFINNNQHPKEDDALIILKKRFARGEITEEEYQRMKNNLNK